MGYSQKRPGIANVAVNSIRGTKKILGKVSQQIYTVRSSQQQHTHTMLTSSCPWMLRCRGTPCATSTMMPEPTNRFCKLSLSFEKVLVCMTLNAASPMPCAMCRP